ncbi:hypothetical protein Peur_026372 [Populus x canadensis]
MRFAFCDCNNEPSAIEVKFNLLNVLHRFMLRPGVESNSNLQDASTRVPKHGLKCLVLMFTTVIAFFSGGAKETLVPFVAIKYPFSQLLDESKGGISYKNDLKGKKIELLLVDLGPEYRCMQLAEPM